MIVRKIRLFDNLQISSCASYREHLNQYDVLKLNMQDFLSITHDVSEMLKILQSSDDCTW